MDFTQVSGDESDSIKTACKVTPGEEYDPSHPLDSSDEEEEPLPCPLTFATSDNVNNVGVPSTTSPVGDKSIVAKPKGGGQPFSTTGEVQEQLSSTTSVGETLKTANAGGNRVGSGVKEPEIDLSSIPMPSDEYRRPTIQFSIPTRHRLMSISSLIKRQKGVVKKQDKDGGSSICYNSEVSKAFNKADGDVEGGDDERPKVSLVQEIFGSDDEENAKDQEEITQSPEDQQGDADSNRGEGVPSSSNSALEGDNVTSTGHDLVGGSSETAEDGSRWKTLEKESGESNEAVSSGGVAGGPDSHEEDDNSREEIRISIKPPSELLEAAGNENSSEGEEPEVIIEESVPDVSGENDNSRGKENKQIILECVSDEEPDFEVTFVGIRRTNVSNLRNKQGQSRLPRRNALDSSPPLRKRSSSPSPRKRSSSPSPRKRSSSPSPRKRSSSPPPRKRSSSPLNGFEEGEIVEMADRKKKKAKKKKSKKRKRSKDSRISSSKASERSTMDSPEKSKSFSENSDSKEVSWRKPKMAKSRNYRNGKRESPDKPTDRSSRNDDSYRRRSPGRYSSANERLKSRRQRSLSNSRFRSRSRSSSRSSPTRWDGRSRGSRLGHRGESHRSRSSISNHSSPSFSRSRSLTKKRGKRRHSPSPAKRHKNGRSASRSPPRPSKSPRLSKRHRTNGTEATKRDKLREKSPSPSDTHALKKAVKPKVDDPVNEESKKKSKKEKIATEDIDKEKRKKRKRKEKSLSPVKAIVADGDSIVVSLSFQKAKEEVPKTPKVTPPAKSESSSEKSKTTNNGNNSECSGDEDSSEKEETTKQSTPKKSTFTINLDLDGSPHERHDNRRSPDIVVLEENNESSKKSENKKSQEQKADGIKNSSTGSSSQRMDGLDFVSSSHECSIDATQNIFPSPGDPKATPSSAERNSTSKSPYKFSEYFVSSTCGDIGKSSSPVVELSSPRVYTSGKPNDSSGTSFVNKNRDNSPFIGGDTGRTVNSCNNGMDKMSPPSPEPLHSSSAKGGINSNTNKPMIGNIPGLFPSGFSSSIGGIGSAPPIVIPAPPRIIPNTSTSNLLNPNVLVSVASALYAPLLAAKQHGSSATMGQSGGNVNLQRHGSSTSAFFQKSLNSHSQPFGLYNNRTRNGPGDQGGEGGDSPFSPNSSDGDDLFEPPGDGNSAEGNNSSRKMGEHHQPGSGNASGSPQFGKYQNEGNRNEKQGLFDTLFSTAPKKATSHSKHSKKKTSSHMKKSRPKSKSMKDKRPEPEKNSEGTEVTSRLNEEVPASAVALKMKEKYLKKLNRQERVVEEVKLCLKPHYSKKHVNKEEYKEILRKAVPKICHNKSGEINPNKIKELVEAYVKKFRRARKSENSAA